MSKLSLIFSRIYKYLHDHEFVLLVIIGVVILRAPNFFEPYWYGDEGIYLTVGQGMKKGLELYAEIVDHKTPMIYWMSYFAQTLIWLKVMLAAASIVSIVLFYHIAREILDKKLGVWVSTIAFALLTTLPRFEGNIANGELLLMPFVLAAVLLFWVKVPKKLGSLKKTEQLLKSLGGLRLFGVGALFSLALLLKVPAGFDFVALSLFIVLFIPNLWKSKNIKTVMIKAFALILGFIVPILLSVLYFASRGTLDAYYDFGLLYNFRYVSLWSLPFTNPVTLFLLSLKGRVLIVLSLISVFALFRKKISSRNQFIFIWLVFSAFAALLSLRPYPHYFIQVMPALSLLIGAVVFEGVYVKIVGIVQVLLLWGVLNLLQFQPYPTVDYYEKFVQFISGNISADSYFEWFDGKTPNTYQVATWLKMHTNEDERVFIWGNEPMVYSLSNRAPVGKFITDFHIASVDAYDETLQSIIEYQPKYILDYVQDGNSFSGLYKLLAEEYMFIEEIGKAKVYRLRLY